MSHATEDSLSFYEVIAWTKKNLRKLVLAGVIFSFLGVPMALLRDRVYESTATLLVSPPTFKDRSKTLLTRDPTVQADSSIAEMMPRALPVESYKAIALSPSLLDEVIKRVPLEKTGTETLAKRLEVELIQMGGRGAPAGSMYTQTLMFHAKAKTAELAAHTAQAWAEVFKEQVDTVAKKGVSETFQLLSLLHTDTKLELEKAELALAEHRKSWNLDLLKAQIDAKQKEYTDFEDSLKQAEVNLASKEIELKTLEDALAKEPEKRIYFRAPSDDAYWITTEQNGGRPKVQPEQGLKTEESNPNYEETRALVLSTMQARDGLKARKDAIIGKLDELTKELKALTVLFSDQTIERDKLMRETDSLKASYRTVRTEYEKGQMAERTQASDIVLLGAAVPPQLAVSTGNTKFVMLIGFLGVFVTAAYLLIKEAGSRSPAS